MSIFVREVQDSSQGKPAISQERRHFNKIHESHCKPWLLLACASINLEVISDRSLMNNDKASTVTLVHACLPRVKKSVGMARSSLSIRCLSIPIFCLQL